MELLKVDGYNNIYEVQGFELEFKNLLKKSGEYQACEKKLKFNLSFLDNSGGIQSALLHKNIEKLSDERNLYSIRNISSVNPRTIFCCAVDNNTYILLTSFLEKSTTDYEKAIAFAKNIKKALGID